MTTCKIAVYFVVFGFRVFLLNAQEFGDLPHITESQFDPTLDSNSAYDISQLKSIFTDPAHTLKVLESISRRTPTIGNSSVSTNCAAALTEVLSALLFNTKIWAVKMIDATGKIGSGILEGNLIWTGSYSTCMSVIPTFSNQTQVIEFQPQFCWSQYSLKLNIGGQQTNGTVGLDEPNMSLRIGLCVPNTCSAGDIANLLFHLNNISSIIHNFINFNSVNCVPTSRDIGADYKAVICLVFCGLVIALISAATLYDLYIRWFTHKRCASESKTELEVKNDGDTSRELASNSICINNDVKFFPIERYQTSGGRFRDVFLCFSFYTNAGKLFNLNSPQDTLTCINGIRVLSMAWIILAHTYMTGAPISDDAMLARAWTTKFSFLLIAQGNFAVDTFFVLSGLLVTYLYLKEYDKSNGKISWLKFYLHRYWRLTPVYMVVLFIFQDILTKYYANGPFWSQNGLSGDKCQKYWWWNLLYINNFMSNSDMCMSHTWYLANDMQFYIISPLILIFLTRNLKIAAAISSVLIVTSWITTGTIASYYDLMQTSFTQQSPKIFDYIYEKPYCRIGAYVIGMICGYLLHRFKCKTNMNKVVIISGWLIAIGLSSSVSIGIYNAHISKGVLYLYGSVNRSAWAIAVCWMIFACCNGYGGIVNDFLSWPIWLPLSRLTYSTYLIHLVVIQTYFTSMDYPPHFSHPYLLFTFFGCFVVSYVAAVFISLAFESPLLGVEKLFLRRK